MISFVDRWTHFFHETRKKPNDHDGMCNLFWKDRW